MIYNVSHEAAHDLENIWLYTFENWPGEQADRYVNLILEELEYICLKPGSGFDFGNIRKGYLRSKVKSHFIFYKINSKEKVIEVVRILHEMMDIESHI